MDSDSEVKPSQNIVDAGTPFCNTRQIIGTGAILNADVSADDAFNLKGAQNKADVVNENFNRYGNIFPEWLTPPDVFVLPSNTPEANRFLISSVNSWALGTVILPLVYNIFTSFVLALLFRHEAKRLKHLTDQVTFLRDTDMMDYSLADKTFFICCWPAALIEILSEGSKLGGSHLKISNLKKVERILDGIAKSINFE